MMFITGAGPASSSVISPIVPGNFIGHYRDWLAFLSIDHVGFGVGQRLEDSVDRGRQGEDNAANFLVLKGKPVRSRVCAAAVMGLDRPDGSPARRVS
jgi:hypothetical protein